MPHPNLSGSSNSDLFTFMATTSDTGAQSRAYQILRSRGYSDAEMQRITSQFRQVVSQGGDNFPTASPPANPTAQPGDGGAEAVGGGGGGIQPSPSTPPGTQPGRGDPNSPPVLAIRDLLRQGAITDSTARQRLFDLEIQNPSSLIGQWRTDAPGRLPTQDPTDITGFPAAGGTTATVPGGGGAPAPFPTAEPRPVTGGGGPINQFLFDEQSREAARRRGAANAFGPEISPLALGALRRPFEQFERSQPITGFGQSQGALGDQFGQFLRNQPTQAGLGSQLSGLLGNISGLSPETPGASAFESRFTTGAQDPFRNFGPAFGAAISPLLAGTNPMFRGRLSEILSGRLQNRLATDPNAFGSAEDLFRDFQGRGFF